MRHSYQDDDDWDSSDEEIDESTDNTDADGTIACPYCRRSIYEDAERCPYCERYVSDVDAPQQSKPLWIAIGVLVCLLIVLFWSFPSLFLKFFSGG